MTIDISDNNPRASYTVAQGVVQTTFTVPFEFFEDADVSVYLDDVLKTQGSHYTLSASTVTMSVTGATGGSSVVLVRSVALERTTDFVAGQDINRASLNQQLDTIVAQVSDLKDKADRTVHLSDSEVAPSMLLTSDRKGRVLAFDSVTGDVEAGPLSNDINTIATNIAEILAADDEAAAAAASATAAASSATAAQTAETAAELAETNAETAETGAATSAATATTKATTATTKASEASTSATNAATSEGNASTSATASANSATAAATSATNAATSETNAATSATNAATSETNAATSATASSGSATASAASATAAATSETNAAASETAAGTSETNAAASASTASTGATTATTKAGEASTSASNAATSATSAQASKDAALAALDSFDDRYLGQKSADPTVDNDGDALVSGALYFNTTDDIMKVYDGSLWVAAYASLSGAMFGANNLSDVADAAGSRQNLGLGTGNSPTFAGLTTTADVSFGDNDKAIFGAGSDLQIYHDGSASYIDDAGSGRLNIRANDRLYLRDTNDSVYAVFYSGAGSFINHNGATKLATTSTGIDVTGTVTADGLAVSGSLVGVAAGQFINTDTANGNGLFVKGGGTNSGKYSLVTQNGSGASSFRVAANNDISFYEDTGTTPKFFWDASAESLGIGTSSPASALDVTGTVTADAIDITESTNARLSSSDAISEVGSGTFALQATNAAGSALKPLGFRAEDIRFATGSSERMRIDASGNVGIGVVPETDWGSTTDALQIGRSGAVWAGATANYVYLSSNVKFDGSNFQYITSDEATSYVQDANGNHIWQYAASGTADTNIPFSEAMRIDPSGNLLVGTTDAAVGSSSSVTGGVISAAGIISNGVDGNVCAVLNRQSSDGEILRFRKDGGTVGSIGVHTNKVLLTSLTGSNTLALGSTTAAGNSAGLYMYHAADSIIPFRSSDNSLPNGVQSLGHSSYRFKDGHFSGTVNAANFNTTSDATLKTNVETLTGSLDAVKSLRGVSYDWIESGGSEIGVIAQEVEAVLPDVVSTNDEGIKSVKYGNMVAVLIEAIKEQQLRIEALELKLGE